MEDLMEQIPTMAKLEILKHEFDGGTIPAGEALEKISYFCHPFFASNALDEAWLSTLDKSVHEGLLAWHLTLAEAIEEVHRQEEDVYHQSLVENYLSTREIFLRARDGARAHKIYFLVTGGKTDLIGDLHSDPEALLSVLKSTKFFESCRSGKSHRLVFMGDYVDRGKAHLAMTSLLLSLKWLFPSRIILLRGNHDGGEILADGALKLPYRKYDEEPVKDYFPTYLKALEEECSTWKGILNAYLSVWRTLGQIAFIRSGDAIDMAVHGGVPRPVLSQGSYYSYLRSLSDLTDEGHLDAFGRTMVQNVMWSDPYRGTGDLREGMGRFYFTQEQVLDFLEVIDVNRMFRGHEAVEEGFREHFDGKVFTVFSSGGKGAFTAYDFVKPKWARINEKGELSCHALKKFEMKTKIFEKHIDNHYQVDL